MWQTKLFLWGPAFAYCEWGSVPLLGWGQEHCTRDDPWWYGFVSSHRPVSNPIELCLGTRILAYEAQGLRLARDLSQFILVELYHVHG